MDSLTICRAAPGDLEVRALLQRHHELMTSISPAESCHVMDPDSLVNVGAVLLAARRGDLVLGVGALKPIGPAHGELKSMHTAAEARGRGVGRAILAALVDEARKLGIGRLSLETGSNDLFAPARSLYAKHGFAECKPFGDYQPDPFSTFMTRVL